MVVLTFCQVMIPVLAKIPTSTMEAKDASWFMVIPTFQQMEAKDAC